MRRPSTDTEWDRISVSVSPQAAAGAEDVMLALSHGIEEQHCGAEARLIAYLPRQAAVRAVERIRERLHALRAAGLEVGSGRIVRRGIRSRAWEQAWRRGLEVVIIPPRIVVKPTWKQYAPQPNEVVIELDPGMAFGTGHHQTTAACLSALGQYVQPGAAVFDIGAGSGILSIAAAKLGARRVVGIEIDEQAARIAANNVALNRVQGIAAIICGDGLRCVRGCADVIVANLTSHHVIALAPAARAHLRPAGFFIASGIATSHGLAVRGTAEAVGLVLVQQQRKDEWLTLVWRVAPDAPAAG